MTVILKLIFFLKKLVKEFELKDLGLLRCILVWRFLETNMAWRSWSNRVYFGLEFPELHGWEILQVARSSLVHGKKRSWQLPAICG